MYQKLIIVGNLGRDPDKRYTPDGTPSCSFSVAVNKAWTTKDGQQHKQTVWFAVTAWRRLAEVCEQYLHKGDLVLVEGELREARAWQGRDGEWNASLEVTPSLVKFLPKGRSDGDGGQAAQPRSADDEGQVHPIEVGDAMDEDSIPF